MDQNFYASLFYQGVHGGAIKLTEENFIFRAQKMIPDKYKNLKIPYKEIRNISYKRKLLIYPVVLLELKSGTQYRFIVFNIKRFLSIMNKKME